MTTHTRRAAAPLLLLVAAALAGCGGDRPAPSAASGIAVAAETGTGAATRLFVQSAVSAEFDVDAGTLTLSSPDDDTFWFTDRPNHAAGTERTEAFVDDVLPTANIDGGGAPNAAVVWRDADTDHAVAVELLGGDYDADADTVVYRVRVIEDTPAALAHHGEFGDVPAGPIDDVVLFIDNMFTSETCKLTVVNATMEELKVGRDDLDGSDSIVPGGSWTASVKRPAGCSGGVEMRGAISGATLDYEYDDPDSGSNHASTTCRGGFTCTATRTSNSSTLATLIYVTEEAPLPTTTVTTVTTGAAPTTTAAG